MYITLSDQLIHIIPQKPTNDDLKTTITDIIAYIKTNHATLKYDIKILEITWFEKHQLLINQLLIIIICIIAVSVIILNKQKKLATEDNPDNILITSPIHETPENPRDILITSA